ncbi:lysophospholipid acyltransferase family protein [Pectinatus sottacetonis]|uniref:lysophospholipid acyltransferase family protein n=1 Tax=Pectinatus sottacetonis TaxID=1002795 RepID=UPI0018C6E0C4|nr:lysophospholipid acyltransferase family protein [Pectinatus sottacetonis]
MELGYRFLHAFFYLLYTVLFSAKAYNVKNVPEKGGVIIAANHLSNWDPMLISCFLNRCVGYMAKEELFKIPILGTMLKVLHSFPIHRGTFDRRAIRVAINKLHTGECMGVFPEGHRSKDGKLQRAASGVALIAAKSGVPVIPTAVINTNRIFKSFCPALKVIYGEPLYYKENSIDKAALQRFTNKIMQRIQDLLNSYKT